MYVISAASGQSGSAAAAVVNAEWLKLSDHPAACHADHRPQPALYEARTFSLHFV